MKVLLLCTFLMAPAGSILGQDLAPRAYVITPLNGNAIIFTWSHYQGGVNFNDAVPITGASGKFSVPTFSYYHSFGVFGHSANLTASLPYGVGTFQGEAFDQHRSVYRSGLLGFSARLSVNLLGGPAMPVERFARWKQKVLLGASLKVLTPTGQYDPKRLVSWGINRWALKPELGYSERWGNWVLDGYAGVWFYTTNPAFSSLPRPQPESEKPIGSLETHMSHDFKPGTWISLDGNFWFGGITSIGGIENLLTRQTASRIGATAAIGIARHQAIKVSYSRGAYLSYGSDYQNLQLSWQYDWIGWPKSDHGLH